MARDVGAGVVMSSPSVSGTDALVNVYQAMRTMARDPSIGADLTSHVSDDLTHDQIATQIKIALVSAIATTTMLALTLYTTFFRKRA